MIPWRSRKERGKWFAVLSLFGPKWIPSQQYVRRRSFDLNKAGPITSPHLLSHIPAMPPSQLATGDMILRRWKPNSSPLFLDNSQSWTVGELPQHQLVNRGLVNITSFFSFYGSHMSHVIKRLKHSIIPCCVTRRSSGERFREWWSSTRRWRRHHIMPHLSCRAYLAFRKRGMLFPPVMTMP